MARLLAAAARRGREGTRLWVVRWMRVVGEGAAGSGSGEGLWASGSGAAVLGGFGPCVCAFCGVCAAFGVVFARCLWISRACQE